MIKKKSLILLSLLQLTSFNVLAESLSPASAVNTVTNKLAINQVAKQDTLTHAAIEVVKLEPAVFVHKVKAKMNTVYKHLFTRLENNGYYVIFEPNIGRNLAHFEKRWGKDYNKNKLESIRSMVFCNGWYANKISNEDPNMLALCPLHVTLIHKKGFTSVLFIKPSLVSQGSSANSIALELEQDVIRIIKESVR